jgi:protoporphyrinogen oxidase
MIYDYIILGGGISGISAARLLQLRGIENFLVLEASPELGGLCRTKRVGGHVLVVGGGHFLCSKYPEVYNFIFSHIDEKDFSIFNRISKISIGGWEIDYPVETNIWQLPATIAREYFNSVESSGESLGEPEPTNFKEWVAWKLGEKIASSYMTPYNQKLWGVPPSELDVDWLHKIPRVDLKRIKDSFNSRQADSAVMPSHVYFYYPKSGGFQRIFDAIAEQVLGYVKLNYPVSFVEYRKGKIIVNKEFVCHRLINTAPWSELANSPLFTSEIRKAIDQLQANSLVVSLHEESYETSSHWLYEPSMSVPHHRMFFIKNYSPESPANGVFKETNLSRWDSAGEALFAEVNRFAYPIPARGWSRNIRIILDYCRQFGIFGLGRWGQWQYFNADVCIREAMQLLN